MPSSTEYCDSEICWVLLINSCRRRTMKTLERSSAFLCVVLVCCGLSSAAFGQNCSAPANAIEAENCLPGNPPSQWDVSGAGDPTIQGFATDISVNLGQTINFK